MKGKFSIDKNWQNIYAKIICFSGLIKNSLSTAMIHVMGINSLQFGTAVKKTSLANAHGTKSFHFWVNMQLSRQLGATTLKTVTFPYFFLCQKLHPSFHVTSRKRGWLYTFLPTSRKKTCRKKKYLLQQKTKKLGMKKFFLSSLGFARDAADCHFSERRRLSTDK